MKLESKVKDPNSKDYDYNKAHPEDNPNTERDICLHPEEERYIQEKGLAFYSTREKISGGYVLLGKYGKNLNEGELQVIRGKGSSSVHFSH